MLQLKDAAVAAAPAADEELLRADRPLALELIAVSDARPTHRMAARIRAEALRQTDQTVDLIQGWNARAWQGKT